MLVMFDTSLSVWRKALLPARATLQQAISNLEESALQIALVVSVDETLIGTITDGDVRRGLLRGLDMKSSIDSIIHREAVVVPPQMERDMVLHMMHANSINALPVVDESRRVIGLHVMNQLMAPTERTNLMVIMAGGQGTRLRPYTKNCPKPLLLVRGKPILEHIIERAKAEGIQHFVLAIHYLGHMVQEYFGDGSRWQVHIDYLHEDTPLGTAGAIGLLTPRPTAPFLVANGDVLTDIRYSEMLDFHCRYDASATMAVRVHEWANPFGVVRTKGVDIIGFEEKPVVYSHVNAGIYVLNPSALDALHVNEYCDMPTLFGNLREMGARTIVYPMHEPWLDVGREEDLNKANYLQEIN
ncbi:MAG: nucleotidyl transferase [Zetaproteobacteria bacterium CG12_big_fil_rev_8_21_14_0_65_55_1124]|nr:MAG: nucleotidyl transferase [Zetaproteobacteria bacterium CG1_02_55_237]PIS20538.1 MAG: nucleotidyl transferase [Zetaproteobacteria bacterium CG08_land_8_20_14_0_20_55_17]PIW43817.1 MAG: nucleotidyl transferase [Zetaproteobacteria bacterium CG12_big_fil_rev_8_21_14_0_65_55_1124]PIY53354.1 MAG: nucleotidyl transferase [Zetaproteobacteria bacterium CG_4_10_14_0_8_um_filter_55_43]PIZ40168.1 MAG: nucleotidyl transferase [Zetaproteobacteria bacterium CG_4_10_14_0_2_um_filter_55_20]PJB82172.1 MA